MDHFTGVIVRCQVLLDDWTRNPINATVSLMSREPDTAPGEEFELTTSEVATLLGVAKSTVRRYADAGYLGTVRRLPSGQRRYDPRAVQKLVDEGGAA